MLNNDSHLDSSTPFPQPARPPEGTPKGRRRITAETLAAERSAVAFAGLPAGVKNPAQITETVTSALRIMGVSSGAIDLARYLARRVKKTDWQATSRPMCWPSSRTIENELCIGERHRRRLQTELMEAGALVMEDSANMKRHGRRDPSGNVITGQAFGYDLATWATCYDSFAGIVRDHAAHCDRRADAWHSAKRDKRKIDDLAKLDEGRADLAASSTRAAVIWADMNAAQQVPDRSLEARAEKTARLEAFAQRMLWLRQEAVSMAAPDEDTQGINHASTVEISEKESGRPDSDVPHKNTTTNAQTIKFVQAQRGSVVGAEGTASTSNGTAPSSQEAKAKSQQERWTDRAPWDGGELRMPEVKTTAAELADLVPEIKRRLATREATWGNVTGALRDYAHDYGISPHTIKRAVRVMGWQSTYIGLAIVASKSEGHFDVSAGAFFNGGMLKRAQRGELDLRRSLYGLREDQPDAAALHKPNVFGPKRREDHAPPAAKYPKAYAAAELAREDAQSDLEEIKAEQIKAASIKRAGPDVQSAGAAVALMALPRDLKRGINAAVASVKEAPAPAARTAAVDPEIAALAADYLAKQTQAKAMGEAGRARLAAYPENSREWRREREALRAEIRQATDTLPLWLRT